jgi:hypothetical protein
MRHGLEQAPATLASGYKDSPGCGKVIPGNGSGLPQALQNTLQARAPISAVQQQRLSKIEACLRRVNDAELWALAKALSCPVAELFPARPKLLTKILRQGRGEGGHEQGEGSLAGQITPRWNRIDADLVLFMTRFVMFFSNAHS